VKVGRKLIEQLEGKGQLLGTIFSSHSIAGELSFLSLIIIRRTSLKLIHFTGLVKKLLS
jgi:hypothetical protein